MEAMRKSFLRTALLAGGLILGLSSIATAQKLQPFGGISIEHYHDMQVFAPYDLGDFGEYPAGATGYYFSYDRMYLNISRPNGSIGSQDGDFAWGNRYDFGWMTDENTGWFITYMNTDSPNASTVVQYPNDTGFGRDFTESSVDTSDLDANSTLNDNDMHSIELNKAWRLPIFDTGVRVEPFFGVRYIQYTERVMGETYGAFTDPTVVDTPITIPDFPLDNLLPEGSTATAPTVDLVLNIRTTTRSTTVDTVNSESQNNLFGGQIGSRFIWERGRFSLATEVRGLVMHNVVQRTTQFERLNITDRRTTVLDSEPPLGLGADFPSDPFITVEPDNSVNSLPVSSVHQFTSFGGDLRMNATYHLSKSFALQAGVQVMGLAQGIDRGDNTPGDNFFNDSVFMAGTTFGVEINR